MKKSFLYIGLIFFVGITLFVFEKNSYSVTRTSARRTAGIRKTNTNSNTKAKSARSATSARRSATNQSAQKARAATTRSATNARSARAASNKRVLSRSGGKKTTPTLAADTTPKVASGNTCPVMTILRKVANDDGTETYYSKRNVTCVEPENAHTMQYSTANKNNLPLTMQVKPSWIEANNAYYFECDTGYLLKTVDKDKVKIKTCIPFTEICPLNTVIENTTDGFLHPNTRENCVATEYSNIINANAIKEIDPNQVARYSYDIAQDDMRMFVCPLNYYADNSNITSNENLLVECKACPNNLYSPRGAVGASSCKMPCNAGETSVFLSNGNYECRACNTKCSTYNSQTKSCDTKSGWICKENGTGSAYPADKSVCDSNVVDIVVDENGNNQCKCPDGYMGNGIKTSLGGEGCFKECGANATMENDKTCECNEGYQGDAYAGCTESPKDLSADDCVDNATFENGVCKCPDGYFGDGIKDNDKSPLCKILPDSSLCQNQYNYSTKQGTQTPRGCVPQCESGSYWAPVN
ncbi:MAG: hypothetical protein ACI4N3_04680 [Alphaproteobacteria bacterium]